MGRLQLTRASPSGSLQMLRTCIQVGEASIARCARLASMGDGGPVRRKEHRASMRSTKPKLKPNQSPTCVCEPTTGDRQRGW